MILRVSGKMATPTPDKGYDVIISVNDVTNKIL